MGEEVIHQEKKNRAESVHMLPELITLSLQTRSCIHGDSHKSVLQQKIFVTTQNFLTNADASCLHYQCATVFVNDNPLLCTYSLRVDDTLCVVTPTPGVSIINAALRPLTTTPLLRMHAVRVDDTLCVGTPTPGISVINAVLRSLTTTPNRIRNQCV